MASSGNFTTNNPWGGGYPGSATFEWWVNSQSVEGNYTDIGFKVYASGGNAGWSIYHYQPSLTVDGKNYTAGNAQRVQGEEYITGTKRIYHNDDGTKSFSASFQASIFYSSGTWATGSGSWNLPTIARKSSPTVSVSEISIPATSGTFTVTTNRKSSSFTHTITLKVGSTTISTKTGVGANTTFNIADIDDTILATIPNDISATVTVTCETFNGSTSIGTNSTTLTAKVNDSANPTFSNFGYKDSNTTITAITGNNQFLVSGKSTLTATISTSQKATANYSASMANYTFTINGVSQSQTYTTSAITKNLGTVTLSSSENVNTVKSLVITATDSRGKSTLVTKDITVIPYNNPVVNVSATRQNGFETNTTIKISGTFSPILVNGTAKNDVSTTVGVSWRYKNASTSSWENWQNKTATVNRTNGTVTVADFIEEFDYQSAWNIEVKITDKLATTTVAILLSVGQPAFFIGEDGRIGVGGMPTIPKIAGEQGLLDVKGRIFTNGREVGTGGDLPDNIVLWDEEHSTPEPETPWVTNSMLAKSTFTFGNYSFTEQDTGFTWVNGKHIYKKTMSTGALPNNTTKNINIGVSGITEIIKITGIIRRASDGLYATLPYSATQPISLTANTSAVIIGTTNDRSSFSGYVTVYYTKNT